MTINILICTSFFSYQIYFEQTPINKAFLLEKQEVDCKIQLHIQYKSFTLQPSSQYLVLYAEHEYY